MARKLRKERLLIVFPDREAETGQWLVKVVFKRVFELPERFDNQRAAEEYGLKWALGWIDAPPD
jgi:hypothetical protein